jgi:hypothetical protein
MEIKVFGFNSIYKYIQYLLVATGHCHLQQHDWTSLPVLINSSEPVPVNRRMFLMLQLNHGRPKATQHNRATNMQLLYTDNSKHFSTWHTL